MSANERTAMIFGATGAVGSHCLDQLLAGADYGQVVSIGRRKTGRSHPKLREIETPLDRLLDVAQLEVGPIEVAFCCLGTTQAKAGSRAEFRRVEVEYPRQAARLAKAWGACQLLLISAIGADAGSPLFYNKVKGEVEAAVIAEGLAATSVFRPSLLLGHRKDFRWKEKFGEPLMRLLSLVMVGPARRLRPIEARTVARALVHVTAAPPPGVTIYSSDMIADLGNG